MVEQDFCDTLAEDAPEEPENVQVVARFSRLGASVTAGGSGAGEAIAEEASKQLLANPVMEYYEVKVDKLMS